MSNDILAGIDFRVRCTDAKRADKVAKYKIAAEWSGGGFTELKTYGFADDECLQRVFDSAYDRAAEFRLLEEEVMGELRVYVLDSSRHDYELQRATDLERKLLAKIAKRSKS